MGLQQRTGLSRFQRQESEYGLILMDLEVQRKLEPIREQGSHHPAHLVFRILCRIPVGLGLNIIVIRRGPTRQLRQEGFLLFPYNLVGESEVGC